MIEKSALTDAKTDAALAEASDRTIQTRSPAYRLAYRDADFLSRDDLRSLRFQMEMLKPDMLLDEAGVESTFVIYGSARIPAPDMDQPRTAMSGHYEEARKLARIASEASLATDGSRHFVVCSGGGPSIMEAANRGAADAGAPSIGLNIVLPFEQIPNRFVTPDLCFQFHYFALRKMHFMLRAKAVAVFPGGFGTLDELFDLVTLMQTGKMAVIPLMLFDEPFWRKVLNLEALVETKMIAPADLGLITFVTTAEEAWDKVEAFYREHSEPLWHRRPAPANASEL